MVNACNTQMMYTVLSAQRHFPCTDSKTLGNYINDTSPDATIKINEDEAGLFHQKFFCA